MKLALALALSLAMPRCSPPLRPVARRRRGNSLPYLTSRHGIPCGLPRNLRMSPTKSLLSGGNAGRLRRGCGGHDRRLSPTSWRTGGAVESKGLKAGALGLASATVIGVASTAPGYSLAASLGFVTAAVGFKAPAIMWISFLPMACIAAAFYYLNRADPDCGTNFTLGDAVDGPAHGLDGRLEHHDRRPHHHAEPRRHRRACTRSCSSDSTASPNNNWCDARRSASCSSWP